MFLIFNICYLFQEDFLYFIGIFKKENGYIIILESFEELSIFGFFLLDVFGMEFRGLFSFDFGIEMIFVEFIEVNKILVDFLDQMKVEVYKYIDIIRSEEVRYQE